MAEIDKPTRIGKLQQARQTADLAFQAFSARPAASPQSAATINKGKIRAGNTRDDLDEIIANLQAAATVKPLSDNDVQDLDRLAVILDQSIRANALLNATLQGIADTVTTAARVGELLDQRA
jgi:hypothetical protein